MKALKSKKVGIRTIIAGAALTASGYVALTLNAFNVYGKVGTITSCPRTSNCGLSSNLLIANIGIVAFFAGLVFIVFGVVVLIVSLRHSK